MIYDRQWFRDVRTVFDRANKREPNTVHAPVYVPPQNYGMYAGYHSRHTQTPIPTSPADTATRECLAADIEQTILAEW